jgi:transposase
MARLSKQKLEHLKKCFTEGVMTPRQAAGKVGVTYATAKRYYGRWSEEIEYRASGATGYKA